MIKEIYSGILDNGATRYCCGCWANRLLSDDLVAFKSDPAKVMTLADAHKIMNQENIELNLKNKEVDRKNMEAYSEYWANYPALKAAENSRKAEEEKIYQSQRKKIDFDTAEYDGRYYDLANVYHEADPYSFKKNDRKANRTQLKENGVCDKIIEELTKADAGIKERKRLRQVAREKEIEGERAYYCSSYGYGTQKVSSYTQEVSSYSNQAGNALASKQEEARRETERQAQARRFRENRQREEQQWQAYRNNRK